MARVVMAVWSAGSFFYHIIINFIGFGNIYRFGCTRCPGLFGILVIIRMFAYHFFGDALRIIKFFKMRAGILYNKI